jgi:hypothetical protein
MTDIIPYTSFQGITTYPQQTQQPATPGQNNGVYITLRPEHRETVLQMIMGWFTGRSEIDLVDTGMSDKVGLGYIILEWLECATDTLFLAILRDEEMIADYTIYTRDLED